MIKKCQKKITCFGATKSSSTSFIKLPNVDLPVERHTMNSFFLMCDLVCVAVTLNVHVALGSNVEDVVIGHTKCCDQ
jgi:hypothetical protein